MADCFFRACVAMPERSSQKSAVRLLVGMSVRPRVRLNRNGFKMSAVRPAGKATQVHPRPLVLDATITVSATMNVFGRASPRNHSEASPEGNQDAHRQTGSPPRPTLMQGTVTQDIVMQDAVMERAPRVNEIRATITRDRTEVHREAIARRRRFGQTDAMARRAAIEGQAKSMPRVGLGGIPSPHADSVGLNKSTAFWARFCN